jgi:hypothetical protein
VQTAEHRNGLDGTFAGLMGQRAGGLGLVGLLIAGPGVACRQLVGITDSPPTDLTSTLCGLNYGTSACASCVQASCCAESTDCSASAACATYQMCVGQCNGDPGCRSQCMISDPGVAPQISALNACLASNCEAACGLTCGSMVERLTPPDAGAACETCFGQHACMAATACASSVDCDEYTRCFVACPTPDCREACATDRDAGAALFAPVQQVYADACSMECAYAQNWNCVGHVVWPATNVTSITQTGTLLDYNTSQPVSGVDVCLSYEPLTCGSPGTTSATTQTDVNGVYTVTLQLPAVGPSDVQPSFQGWIRFSSPNIVTAWGLQGFPQTEAAWAVTPAYADTVVTPGEFAMNCEAVGITCDPSRAVIALRVYDCLGTAASNVQVALEPDVQDSLTTVWYDPNSSATPSSEAGDAGTNGAGLAIFQNVLAPDAGVRNVMVTATPMGLGKVSSYQGLSIQASVITAVEMPPTPNP